MKRPVYLIRSWEILYYKYIQVLHCNSVYSPKLKKKRKTKSFLLVMYLCISFFSEIKKTAEISLKYLYGDQPRYRKAVCDVASFRKRNSIADHLLPIWNRLFLTKQTEHIIVEEQNILIDRCLLACNFLCIWTFKQKSLMTRFLIQDFKMPTQTYELTMYTMLCISAVVFIFLVGAVTLILKCSRLVHSAFLYFIRSLNGSKAEDDQHHEGKVD